MNPRSASLAAAALAAAAGLGMAQLPGGHTVVGTPEAIAKTQTQVRADTGMPTSTRAGTNAQAPVNWARTRYTRRRYPAPGWSVDEDRRRAKKKRAQARNRRAHRGGAR
jgi:hypothetical protein